MEIKYLILLSIWLPFLYFNYKILISDIKNKKIPNKYLLTLILLLPINYLYLLTFHENINYPSFILQIIFTIIIWFIIYYFWIWAAGDIKYLLTLWLFIPHIWIIPLIGNIALVVIIYLFLYFIYFYIFKIIYDKVYRKSLIKSIKTDLINRWKTYIKNKKWTTLNIILKWLIFFLVLFILIRLIRLYMIKYFFPSTNQSILLVLVHYLEKYGIYAILLIGWIILALTFLIKRTFNIIKFIIRKKTNTLQVENLLLFFFATLLIVFITCEYYINPKEIKLYLYKILTIYITLYLTFKLLIYLYKITFILWEEKFIHISKLKEWDIIDKSYLINLFWTQTCLWAPWKKQNKKWILYPSPKKHLLSIPAEIDKETLKLIKKIYKITNEYHVKENTKWFQEITTIKILKTFPFAPYIFIGFLITIVYKDIIWIIIIKLLYKALKID